MISREGDYYLPLDFFERIGYNNYMISENVKTICTWSPNKHHSTMVLITEDMKPVNDCYEEMRQLAVQQNCLIEYEGNPHHYERFFFQYEGKTYCWWKIFSETPFNLFETVESTQYKMIQYGSVAE